MTPELEAMHKAAIDDMNLTQMAILWRTSPTDHVYFTEAALTTYFSDRFTSLGGWTRPLSLMMTWYFPGGNLDENDLDLP